LNAPLSDHPGPHSHDYVTLQCRTPLGGGGGGDAGVRAGGAVVSLAQDDDAAADGDTDVVLPVEGTPRVRPLVHDLEHDLEVAGRPGPGHPPPCPLRSTQRFANRSRLSSLSILAGGRWGRDRTPGGPQRRRAARGSRGCSATGPRRGGGGKEETPNPHRFHREGGGAPFSRVARPRA